MVAIRKILVAIDGSETAWKALDIACDVAAKYAAELIILHVVADPRLPPNLHRYAEAEHLQGSRGHLYYDMVVDKLADEARARAKANGIGEPLVLCPKGDAASVILDLAASLAVDAIFMGKRGLGPFKEMMLGSVSHKVASLAPCSCVTVT